MVIERLPSRSFGRTLMSALLVAVAISLGVAVWLLSDTASKNKEDPARWVYFVRMAYLATVLLLVVVVLLAMRAVRWIVARFKPPPPVQPTSQVSAWVEAGKRFELPKDESGKDDQEPSGT
jgi:cytochrome bd-type quinol oxidase subunit 2